MKRGDVLRVVGGDVVETDDVTAEANRIFLNEYWKSHLHDILKAELLFGPKTRSEALAEAAKWRRRAKRYRFRWWRRRALLKLASDWERRAEELPESLPQKTVRWRYMGIDTARKEKP